jgi:hypothetical protein
MLTEHSRTPVLLDHVQLFVLFDSAKTDRINLFCPPNCRNTATLPGRYLNLATINGNNSTDPLQLLSTVSD